MALLSSVVNDDGSPLYFRALGLLHRSLCISLSFELYVSNTVKNKNMEHTLKKKELSDNDET